MEQEQKNRFLKIQANDITDYQIYKHLSTTSILRKHQKILLLLATYKLNHYQRLTAYTSAFPAPHKGRVYFYVGISYLLGLTFCIQLLEKRQNLLQSHCYPCPLPAKPLCVKNQMIGQLRHIQEDKLKYLSSIVLGLNDALVEFTGALAGYTFALQQAKWVALTGSITGIAAALSMATSEYLSVRTEQTSTKQAIKAAIYTGSTYLITVAALISPFLIISNVYWGLGICLAIALSLIALFNYYYAIVKNETFKHRFSEMAIISLGIAIISFFIGYLLRLSIGLETLH